MFHLQFPIPNIDVLKVYLFGSTVLGNGDDIDILVISNDFEGMSRLKRKEKILVNFDCSVDAICITVKEFSRLSKQNSILLKNILAQSLLVYEKPGQHTTTINK